MEVRLSCFIVAVASYADIFKQFSTHRRPRQNRPASLRIAQGRGNQENLIKDLKQGLAPADAADLFG